MTKVKKEASKLTEEERNGFIIIGAALVFVGYILYSAFFSGSSEHILFEDFLEKQGASRQEVSKIQEGIFECISLIENKANYQAQVDLPNKIYTTKGKVDYGLSFDVKFQNGFGAWSNERCLCYINVKTGYVSDLRCPL